MSDGQEEAELSILCGQTYHDQPLWHLAGYGNSGQLDFVLFVAVRGVFVLFGVYMVCSSGRSRTGSSTSIERSLLRESMNVADWQKFGALAPHP